jgi:predicted DNA-binding protein
MKITIAGPAYKIIGSLRVSDTVYAKISTIAKREKCSNQEVVRAILEKFIHDVE